MTALALSPPALRSPEDWLAELTRLAASASHAASLAMAALERSCASRDAAPPETQDKAEQRVERALRTHTRLSSLALRTLTLLARARGWFTPARQTLATAEPGEPRLLASIRKTIEAIDPAAASLPTPTPTRELTRRDLRNLQRRQA